MTLYERVKTVFLLALLVGLVFLVRSVMRVVDQVDRTLVYTQAMLYSVNGVGPQAVDTLKTLQSTVSTVGTRANGTLQAATGTANHAARTLDGVAATLASVNRPCGVTTLPCGTLADVNRTLATVRGTFGQLEVAARHEDRNLDLLDSQERRAADDLHITTVNLNALVASPDIKRFLAASADTSVQVAGIAKDVHREADVLTAPRPWYTKLPVYGSTAVNVACLVTHSCPF